VAISPSSVLTMDQQTRDAVTFLLGTFMTVLIIIGLATRYILVPYLREHLIAKVDETHKQVTENHHSNKEQPTVLDRIEDVHRDVMALAQVMDAHMDWSDRWTSLWEHELETLKEHKHNGGTDDPHPAT